MTKTIISGIYGRPDLKNGPGVLYALEVEMPRKHENMSVGSWKKSRWYWFMYCESMNKSSNIEYSVKRV